MFVVDDRWGGALSRELEIPDGAVRLDGPFGHWFGYGVPAAGDGIWVVFNALDYLDEDGETLGDPVQDIRMFKNSVAALERTETEGHCWEIEGNAKNFLHRTFPGLR